MLAEESDLVQITVDVCTERPAGLPVAAEPVEWDASIVVSSASAIDIDSTEVDDLLVDSAMVSGRWNASVFEIADLAESWPGTATPAKKVSFVLEPANGTAHATFETWLENDLQEATQRSADPVGARAIVPVNGSTDQPTVVSYWFPTNAVLEGWVRDGLFDSLVESALVERSSIRTYMSVEHRLVPNPNAWSMPTEPLLVRRTGDDDSASSS